MRVFFLIAATFPLLAGACTRPGAVRTVAASALPIAVQLQASAPALEGRMAQQLRSFDERSADQARLAALRSEEVSTTEREWMLNSSSDRLRRLALLRSSDDALLASPLGSSPLDLLGSPANAVPTGDLKVGIETLTGLTGRRRISAAEMLAFAASVHTELEKVRKEAGTPSAQP